MDNGDCYADSKTHCTLGECLPQKYRNRLSRPSPMPRQRFEYRLAQSYYWCMKRL